MSGSVRQASSTGRKIHLARLGSWLQHYYLGQWESSYFFAGVGFVHLSIIRGLKQVAGKRSEGDDELARGIRKGSRIANVSCRCLGLSECRCGRYAKIKERQSGKSLIYWPP